jgi:hypothetical protein
MLRRARVLTTSAKDAETEAGEGAAKSRFEGLKQCAVAFVSPVRVTRLLIGPRAGNAVALGI